MLCANCGAQLDESMPECQDCGAARPDVTPATAVTLPSATVPAEYRHWIVRIFVASGMTVALLWSYMFAVAAYGTSWSAELLGYWMGTLIVPLLAAYVIAGRKNSRNWTHLAIWFAALTIVLPTVNWLAVRGLRQPAHPQAWMRQRIREPAGMSPVSSPARAGGGDMEAVTRDAMRAMLEYRKDYDTKVAAFNSGLAKLYSAESFSSEQAAQQSVDVIKGIVNLDKEMSDYVQRFPEVVKARVAQSALSPAQKTQFVEGITRSLADSEVLAARNRAITAESEWADATVDLYAFASRNRQHVAVSGDQLTITDPDVRAAFNEKLQRSQMLRDNMVKWNSQLEELQSERLKRFGVSRKELGLEQ